MKAILEFDLDDVDDRQAFDDAVNGTKYKIQIDEIWERLFRPSYKHGYDNELLNKGESYQVIDTLARMYQEITQED